MFRRTVAFACLMIGVLGFINLREVMAAAGESDPRSAAIAEAQQAQEVLTNDSIIQLLKVGLGDDLIIAKIQKSKTNFDTSTSGLIALKQAGVSDRLLHIIMDPTSAPGAPAAGAAPAAAGPAPRNVEVPAQPKTGDPVADSVPAESGLYYLRDSTIVRMDIRTLASAKVAGRIGHLATFGVKSVKNNAYLIGPSAKTRSKDTSPVFYARLPEGMSIDELVLVSLYVKSDRRELEVGAAGGIVGSKQGLRMEVMKPTESRELAPRFYKVATSILGRGEYLFYIIGSGDSIKGIQGKGYDFGID